MLDASMIKLDVDEEVPSESLKLISHDVYMNCDEDHIQVGGVCHPGEGSTNYIEIGLTRDGEAVPFGAAGTTFKIRDVVCENGRFFVVIPRPNDNVKCCNDSSCSTEYRVQSQIFVSEDGSQYRAGNKGTNFPIRIQPYQSCTPNPLPRCS